MKRTRSLFHTFYLIVIAVLATLLYLERDEQPDPVIATLVDSQNALQQELTVIQSTLHDAQQSHSEQLDQLMVQVSQLTRAPSNVRPHSNATETTESDSTASATNQPVALVSSPLSNEFALLKQQFNMQSVDPDWAYATRELLLNRVESSALLGRHTLSDIECRSTLCRIELSLDTDEQINSQQLAAHLSGHEPNVVFQVHLDDPEQPQVLLVERLPAR